MARACVARPLHDCVFSWRSMATVEAYTPKLVCLTLKRDTFTEILGPLEQVMAREKSNQVRGAVWPLLVTSAGGKCCPRKLPDVGQAWLLGCGRGKPCTCCSPKGLARCGSVSQVVAQKMAKLQPRGGRVERPVADVVIQRKKKGRNGQPDQYEKIRARGHLDEVLELRKGGTKLGAWALAGCRGGPVGRSRVGHGEGGRGRQQVVREDRVGWAEGGTGLAASLSGHRQAPKQAARTGWPWSHVPSNCTAAARSRIDPRLGSRLPAKAAPQPGGSAKRPALAYPPLGGLGGQRRSQAGAVLPPRPCAQLSRQPLRVWRSWPPREQRARRLARSPACSSSRRGPCWAAAPSAACPLSPVRVGREAGGRCAAADAESRFTCFPAQACLAGWVQRVMGVAGLRARSAGSGRGHGRHGPGTPSGM
jgi:hypothetical protein